MKQAVGRNDPCPCGSGKKYKKCCGSPKLASRNISVVRGAAQTLQQKISGISQEGIANTQSSLAGRVIAATKMPSQEKD